MKMINSNEALAILIIAINDHIELMKVKGSNKEKMSYLRNKYFKK